MVKDFIDTNDFSARELLDMIQLSLSIKMPSGVAITRRCCGT